MAYWIGVVKRQRGLDVVFLFKKAALLWSLNFQMRSAFLEVGKISQFGPDAKFQPWASFYKKRLACEKKRISDRLIIRAMLECTVATCLCSEVSEVSPTVNCIFHKYQTFGDNYCKSFGCLKARFFVNGTNSEKETWNSHALLMSLCLSQMHSF